MEFWIGLVIVVIIGLCIFWAGGFANFIGWLVGIALVIILIVLIVKLASTLRGRRIEKRIIMRTEQQANERDYEEQMLIKHYVTSSALHEALLYICRGSLSNRPVTITVDSGGIVARYNSRLDGETIRYGFLENRVEPPTFVNSDAWYKTRPIMAMAQAISAILGNDYELAPYSCGEIAFLELKANRTF